MAKDKLTILVNHAPHGFGPSIVSVAEVARIMETAGVGKDEYQMVVPMVNSWEVNDPDLGDVPITEKIFLKDQPFADLPILFSSSFGSFIDCLNFKGEGNYGDRLKKIVSVHKNVQANLNDFHEKRFNVRRMGTDETFNVYTEQIDFVFGHNPILNVLGENVLQYFSTIAPFSRLIEASFWAKQFRNLICDYEIPEHETLYRIGQIIENRQTMFFTSTPSTLTGVRHEHHTAFNETIVPPIKDRVEPQDDIADEGIYVVRSGIGPNVPYLLEKLEIIVAYAKATGLKVYSADGDKKDEVYARETACAHPNIKAVVGRLGLSAVYMAHVHGKPMITFGYQPQDDTEMFFNERTFRKQGTILVYDGNTTVDRMFDSNMDSCTRHVTEVYSGIEKEYGTLSGDEVIANHVVDDLRRQKVL